MDWALGVLIGCFAVCIGGLLFMDWLETRRTIRIVKDAFDKYWH